MRGAGPNKPVREGSATATEPLGKLASEALGFVASQNGKVWVGLSCPASQMMSPGHHFTFHLSALPSLDWLYFQTFRMQGGGCSCNLHPSRPKSSGKWSCPFPTAQTGDPQLPHAGS